MAKKALLVGINRYRIPGADLRGCVNDVRNVEALLREVFGFKKKDITTLTDFAATKRAIQAGVQALVRGGRPGDVLLFHFSGHGSNVPDDNGDEADARDEIICPTDLDWKNPLRDDWLRKTFDKVKPGVSFTVLMDCCHSGTITRAVQPPDAPIIDRFLPSPWDLVAVESGRQLRGRVTPGLHAASRATRSRSDTVVADIPEVLFTGCRDTQTSADAMLGGDFNGALTYCLVAALRKNDGVLTHRLLRDRAADQLATRGFSQVPQLEGRKEALDYAFLSARA
jgi:hypothetical protein